MWDMVGGLSCHIIKHIEFASHTILPIYPPIVAHLNFSHHIINIPFFSPNITVGKPVNTSDTCDFRTLNFRGEVDEDVWDQSHSMS